MKLLLCLQPSSSSPSPAAGATAASEGAGEESPEKEVGSGVRVCGWLSLSYSLISDLLCVCLLTFMGIPWFVTNLFCLVFCPCY